MSNLTAIAIYILIWWLTLFAVLPFGVRSQEESGSIDPGTDPGAPMLHRVGRKLLWTTLVSAMIFGVCAWIYVSRIVTFDGIATFFGL
jgi:predicted secreted protein